MFLSSIIPFPSPSTSQQTPYHLHPPLPITSHHSFPQTNYPPLKYHFFSITPLNMHSSPQPSLPIRVHIHNWYSPPVLHPFPFSHSKSMLSEQLPTPQSHPTLLLQLHPHSPPNFSILLPLPSIPHSTPLPSTLRFPIILCKHNPPLHQTHTVSFFLLGSLNRFEPSTLLL